MDDLESFPMIFGNTHILYKYIFKKNIVGFWEANILPLILRRYTHVIRCLWQLPNLVGKELQELPDAVKSMLVGLVGWGLPFLP